MGLTVKEKQPVIRESYQRYQSSGKKDKSEILDELCQITGLNRPLRHNQMLYQAAVRLTPLPLPPRPVMVLPAHPQPAAHPPHAAPNATRSRGRPPTTNNETCFLTSHYFYTFFTPG
jgi:hypothetical protein